MPKLFFFFPLASIGGTERVHLDVLNALTDFDKEIYIRYRRNPWKGIAFRKTQAANIEGIQLLPEFKKHGAVTFVSNFIEAPRFGRLIRACFIKRLAKKINACENPIVVFWHRESIAFLWEHLAPHVKIIDIIHNNSNNDSPDATYLTMDWAPRINARVLVHQGLMKFIEPLYEVDPQRKELSSRLRVIPHGVRIPENMPSKASDGFNVLFVGRDAQEKRFHLFIEIAKRLASNAAIRFHVVGIEPSYDSMEQKNMQWHGVISDKKSLEALYRYCHVLVLTSSSEGFPMVIAEAMASGCVPIVTSVGAIPDLLQHGEEVFLTSADHCVDESVDIINALIDDPERFNEHAKKAYIYACKHFDLTRFTLDWRTFIQSLG